jgi:hypothetical protein
MQHRSRCTGNGPILPLSNPVLLEVVRYGHLSPDAMLCTVAALYTPLGDVEEIFNPLGVSLGASES